MDPNISLVFETIGEIKRSLQCSICLELLNNPHSTKCNHQFCSQCIIKVVDERRSKKKDALCPLCKNPITKRSLTGNPRLKEIVEVVQKLNDAFKKDAEIPDSPYPVVHSRNEGECHKNYLQFVAAHPTPQKSVGENVQTGSCTDDVQQVPDSSRHRNTDTPISRPKDSKPEQNVPSLSLPEKERNSGSQEIFALLDEKITAHAGDGDNQKGSSRDSTAEDDKTKSICDKQQPSQSGNKTRDLCEKTSSPDNHPGSNATEAAESPARVSSSSCPSVSILESLTFSSETENEPTRDNSCGDEGSSMELDDAVKNAKENHSELEEFPYVGTGSDATSKNVQHDDTVKRNSRKRRKRREKIVQDGTDHELIGSDQGGSVELDDAMKNAVENHSKLEEFPYIGTRNDDTSKNVPHDDTVKRNLRKRKKHRKRIAEDGYDHELIVSDEGGSVEVDDAMKNARDNNSESEEFPYIGTRTKNVQQDPDDTVKRRLPKQRKHHKRIAEDGTDHELINNSSQSDSLPKLQSPIDDLVVSESSCDFVPGSIESDSSAAYTTSGGICIPRLDKFLVKDHVKSRCKEVSSDFDHEANDCEETEKAIVEGVVIGHAKSSQHSRATKDPDTVVMSSEQALCRNLSTDDGIPQSDGENDTAMAPPITASHGSSRIWTKLSPDCDSRANKDSDAVVAGSEQAVCGRASSQDGVPRSDGESDEKWSSRKLALRRPSKRRRCEDTGQQPGTRKCRRLNQDDTMTAANSLENATLETTGTTSARMLHHGDSKTITVKYDDTSSSETDMGSSNMKKPRKSERLGQSVKKGNITGVQKENECLEKNSGSQKQPHATMIESADSEEECTVLFHNPCDKSDRNAWKLYKSTKFGEPGSSTGSTDLREKTNAAINDTVEPNSRQVCGENVRTSENDTEDEIVPPTPPITDCEPASSKGVQQNIPSSPILTRQRTGSEEFDKLFDLDGKERVADGEAKSEVGHSPEENSLSSQDDLEPCDQDNIALLRNLGSATNKESENETDDDASDSRTVDTTSVSSLNEGDDIDDEASSQRILYLRQVVAKTGGEIDKLTTDLNNLRDSEGMAHFNDESEADEEEDEKQSDCSVSPPPSPEPSTITLTKLPAAIKDMQMMLQNNSDSEDETFSQRRAGNVSKKIVASLEHKTATTPLADVAAAKRSLNLSRILTMNNNDEKENNFSRPLSHVHPKEVTAISNSKERRAGINETASDCIVMAERKTSNVATSIHSAKTGPSSVGRMGTRAVPKPISFVVTRLPKKFVALAGYLAKRNGGNMTADLTSETTHVIMPTDSQMFTSRKNYTIKYLLGVALGKWIISQLWLTACMKAGRLVDEKPFEVKGDPDAAQNHVPHLSRTSRESQGPGLFDGVSLICFGDFNGAISREHVVQLVQFCGGHIVTSKKEAISEKISDVVVITDNVVSNQAELLVKDFCETYHTFPVSAEWVTDSVANYQLQDIEEYRVEC